MPSGSKPGERRGGRQKGTPNRRSAEIIERVAATGMMPLDVMLEDMNRKRDAGDYTGAADRARDAAPYLHAKLASVEQKISADVTMRDAVDRPAAETREQWNARRRRELGLRLVTPAGSAN